MNPSSWGYSDVIRNLPNGFTASLIDTKSVPQRGGFLQGKCSWPSPHALEKRCGSQPTSSQLIAAGFLLLKKEILRGERRPHATFSPP
jgi:hypothetical protein